MRAKLELRDPMGKVLESMLIDIPITSPTPMSILDSNSKRTYQLKEDGNDCMIYVAQAYLVIRGSEVMLADAEGQIQVTEQLYIYETVGIDYASDD